MAFKSELKIEFCGNLPALSIKLDQPDSKPLSSEKVLEKCLEHIQFKICTEDAVINAPLHLPAFGLFCTATNVWLPLHHEFKRDPAENIVCKFLVRFRPPASVFKDNNILFEYLFLQLLDDFLNGDLAGRENLSDSDVLSFLTVALFIPNERPLDGNQIINHEFSFPLLSVWNLNRKVSEEIKKKLNTGNIVHRYYMQRTIKKFFKKFMDMEEPLKTFKKKVFEKLLMAVPDYCFEEFRADEVVSNDCTNAVTVHLCLYNESKYVPQLWGLYYGEDFGCPLSQIDGVKLIKPRNREDKKWTVQIDMKQEPPKQLIFRVVGMAESFISLLQGYISLFLRADIYLNPAMKSSQTKLNESLRSFWPISPDKAKLSLQGQKMAGEPCAFLIYQSMSKFGHFVVVVQRQGERDAVTFIELEVEHNIYDGSFIVTRKEADLEKRKENGHFCETTIKHCDNKDALLSWLKFTFGPQLLPRKITKAERICDMYDIYNCDRIDDYYVDSQTTESEDGELYNHPEIFLTTDLDLDRKRQIEDKNPFLEKFNTVLTVKDEHPVVMLVELKKNPGVETDRLQAAFREGIGRLLALSRKRREMFLRIYGYVLDNRFPVVLETPSCDLLTYLSKRQRTIKQSVNIAAQIISILKVMDDENLFHGNIRCRRFMVFCREGGVSIKLGDPGIISYLDSLPIDDKDNDERIPWLSPERRKDLKKVTYESECYAVGTTLCEILYRNDDFSALLRLDPGKTLRSHLSNKTLDRPPLFWVDTQLVRDVTDALWNVITDCWNIDPQDRPDSRQLKNSVDDIQLKANIIEGEVERDNLIRIAYDATGERPEKLSKSEIAAFIQKNNKCFIKPEGVMCSNDNLGKGHFGDVWYGKIKESNKEVAIKYLRTNEQIDNTALMKEIMTASELNHPNIVKLLYFSYNDQKIDRNVNMLIMEFMNRGSLKKFVSEAGAKAKMESKNPEYIGLLYGFGLDITKGMVYMNGKHFVHRDLAARNILLHLDKTTGKIIAKVADFGLARSLGDEESLYYYPHSTIQLPLFGVPPECLKSQGAGRFHLKADVWAFGTLLWEMLSSGKSPCNEVELSGDFFRSLYDWYSCGHRLKRQSYMPEDAYKIMMECWQLEYKNRPPFVELERKIQDLLDKHNLRCS